MNNKANRSRLRREPPNFSMEASCLLGLLVSNNMDPIVDYNDSMDEDETVQFAADSFVYEQFRVPTKKKRTKSSFHGLARAIAREEQAAMPTCSTASEENANHSKKKTSTLEESQRRILEGLRSRKTSESTTEVSDPAEIKAKKLDSLLKDGFEAYSLGHYALAATKYKFALEMLADVTLKSRTEHVREDVLCYMVSMSLLETDQFSNLSEAIELLTSIEKRSSQTLPAVYYALSKAHQKHCRFETALKSIEEGFAILESDAQLTEYTIPGSDEILKESTKDGLSLALALMKEECSKWHPPDATCCANECVHASRWYGPNKNIYFRDPAFNGMVVLTCSNGRFPCAIKFHQACWKLRKDQLSVVKKLSDKDILGHECFTPNCESAQGESSVITKVEVYGDDSKLKTNIEAPANPVVWAKRRPVPKGAIPKQPVKPKRPLEKPRRPIIVSTPRTNCKESTEEDGLKKSEGLAKLAKLRKNNFGVKSDYQWRPDMVMYGNSQMTEVVDYLGGPVLENDSEHVAGIKTFIFTYVYEYIKENGCVSKKDILQKWEEDKYSICDNFNEALRNYTDICEFLLQSYKLVSIGDYMSIAENLPELYSLVRGEVCGCLRFYFADSIRPSKTNVQDDIYNMVICDFDEKQNKDRAKVSARISKTETTTNQTRKSATTSSDSTPLKQGVSSSQETCSEATETHSEKENGTVESENAEPSETVAVKQDSNNDYVNPEEFVAFPLVSENSAGPKNGSRQISISVNEEEAGAALVESENQSSIMKTEINHSEEQVSCQENDVRVPVDENINLEENINFDENIEPISDPDDPEQPPRDSDEVEPDTERIPAAEICTESAKVEENEIDTVVLQASQSTDTEKNVDVEKSDEPLGLEKKTEISKNDTDMTIMISKYYAQMIQKEIIGLKLASQADKNELEENFKILKERYAKLESDKKEIAFKLENCERKLRQSSEENDLLKLEKTELICKYEKLTAEKAELQLNFDVLMDETNVLKNKASVMENNISELEELNVNMLRQLAKCNMFINEKTTRESLQKDKTQSEQEPSEDVTKSSARRAKIESLEREYLLNNTLLEKAYEKCQDYIRMYDEVEKLLTALTGQQFAMVEALEPWHRIAYFLRQAMTKLKEDYSIFRSRLESNESMENFEEFKLQIPSIAFPQLPPLVDMYYRNAQAKLMMQYMQWGPRVPGPRHVNPFGVPPPGRPYFPPLNIHPGANDPPNVRYAMPFPRDPRADVMNKFQPEQISPRNDIHDAGRMNQNGERNNDDAEHIDQRKQNPSGGSNDPFDTASQIPIESKSNPFKKKIGTDSLVEKMRLKFEGVPEIDLLDSVQELRKMHNDSLSGMRIEDIIRETEPLIKMRQEKHMASYLPPPAQNSQPQNRSLPLPRNKKNQRVRKPKRCPTAENFDFKGNDHRFDLPGSSSSKSLPSAPKKPAWASVSSGLPNWKKSEEDTECTICYDGMNVFGDKNPPYSLPCKHSYHTSCIKKWLAENSVCPICRIHCTMDTEFPPLP